MNAVVHISEPYPLVARDPEEHESETMTVTTPTIKLKPTGALMPQVGFGLLVAFSGEKLIADGKSMSIPPPTKL